MTPQAPGNRERGNHARGLILGLSAILLFSQDSLYAGDGTTAASPSPSLAAYEPFIPGLIDAFGQALTTPAYTAPQPGSTPTPRRGLPVPFDAPLFFTSDYQIGGTQIIGTPVKQTVWPVMNAVYGSGPFGLLIWHHNLFAGQAGQTYQSGALSAPDTSSHSLKLQDYIQTQGPLILSGVLSERFTVVQRPVIANFRPDQ
jgi:hypothetical protein